MGRPLRIDFEGAWHHIVVKGINNSHIFRSDEAKRVYYEILEKYKDKHDVYIFAYCMMDNHIHLMILSGKAKSDAAICISDFMHDVQCAFAKWYNKRFKRSGPVFNSRFKSFNCLSLPYFIYCIDYIHRNPMKHGKTNSYYYEYSSYVKFFTGEDINDIDKCCDFLAMSKAQLREQLSARQKLQNLPIIDQLIEKIKAQHENETLEHMLNSLAFKLEDLRGARLNGYFKGLQRKVIYALVQAKRMPIKAISMLFEVSTSYIYKQLKQA
ncbi:MAG: hypothetical protein CSB19_00025 [Clostridiales bacterium]|nr:MAG: hypothetical protein CSB19_00025 [Clostridiales bacterium]